MIQANREFIRGIRSLAAGWQVWVMTLMALNMLIPVFFYDRPEAQWIFAAFMRCGALPERGAPTADSPLAIKQAPT